ncbi:hypothetical protein C8Q76DRAFT_692065 [Earliella scabrosa]|nr:hypothetical protein C8Q76DRAFT_692065 [Earliella scabrosa]
MSKLRLDMARTRHAKAEHKAALAAALDCSSLVLNLLYSNPSAQHLALFPNEHAQIQNSLCRSRNLRSHILRVVETPEIGEKWQQWCKTHKLSDIWEGYFPVHYINAAKLQHTVKENASELIIDADMKELLAVIICSCLVPVDDPGHLGHSGYTGGLRNVNERFHWAKNLKSAKLQNDSVYLADLQYHDSSICAFFWNMALSTLSMYVLQPYETYLKKHFFPCMAPTGTPYATHGIYTVPIAPQDGHNPHIWVGVGHVWQAQLMRCLILTIEMLTND